MKAFLHCVLYLFLAGISFFFVGEALPRRWFHPDRRPFSCMKHEQNGKIYDHLHIRGWKDRVPDLSKLLPDMIPKRLRACESLSQMDRLIRETCVAELTHNVLIGAGLACLWIWPGRGGRIMSLLWAVGNVPFILIQRYNRPRLEHLAERLHPANHQTNHQKGAFVV